MLCSILMMRISNRLLKVDALLDPPPKVDMIRTGVWKGVVVGGGDEHRDHRDREQRER